MMEPHASIAAWDGDKLTLWTSNQMIDWSAADLAKTLGIPKENVRLISPFIGGGFGGKLFLRADALLAALGARAAGRPVKVALPRPLMFNNTDAPAGDDPAHPHRRDAGTARSPRSAMRAGRAICPAASRRRRSSRRACSMPAPTA